MRELRQAEADAARCTMQLVVAWAAVHPGPGLDGLAPGEVYADHEVELAGPGAPGVSEFAVVELAAALGMSTPAGKRYVGDVLELAHRLPTVWTRVVEGELPGWRARTVAQRTKQLSAEAATWIDERVGPLAHKVGPTKLTALIEKALVLFDLEEHVERTLTELQVSIMPGAGLSDVARVEATLQLDDALALEAAISARAHDLIGEFPGRSLDERRALGLGSLADAALGDGRREVSLVVHLGEPELDPAHLGRVSARGCVNGLVTAEAVAAWCQRPGAHITIRPVLDLGTNRSCAGYVPSPSLRDHVSLLSETCAFPHCPLPAERCDLDHIVAWAAGGATTTTNLAPLCRLHHRAKTHGGWTYAQPSYGVFHWTSPAGHRYQRDRDGTTELPAESGPSAPRCGSTSTSG